jgi:hypothetical protein
MATPIPDAIVAALMRFETAVRDQARAHEGGTQYQRDEVRNARRALADAIRDIMPTKEA